MPNSLPPSRKSEPANKNPPANASAKPAPPATPVRGKASPTDSPASQTNKWIEGVFGPLARSVPPPLAALVLVILFAILRLGEKFDPAVAYIAMCVVAVVSIVYFYFYHKQFQGEERMRQHAQDEAQSRLRELEVVKSVPTPDDVVWSRLQVRLNLPDETLNQLRSNLERVHEAAFTWLSRQKAGVSEQALRLNIMLPDNRRASYGEVCQLFIPKLLYINMDHAPDRDIRFSLTQGLVGKVYSSNAPGIAVYENDVWKRVAFGKPEPKLPDEPDFELTEWQKRLLHPDLRWVLSLPLLYKDTGDKALALGVLNIDGIGCDLAPHVIKDLYFVIAEMVTLIAASLGEKPKERIAILQQHASL
jgi:hypothetical protein